MGQYWHLINLDKEEQLEEVYDDWFEPYYDNTQTAIHMLTSNNPWAGDRIMLRSYDTGYFPPGVLTEEDKEIDMIGLQNFRLASYGEMTVDRLPSNGENTIVLRNLSAREYITDRLFPRKSASLGSCHSS
jgi:hypothetical protein